MIVLAIDPALTNSGWAIVTKTASKLKYLASGVIKTTVHDPLHKRLAFIYNTIEHVVMEYRPHIVAIEETFVNQNSVSSLKLGYARGAIMALIGKHNLDLREFKPNSIKKTVTGYGHAEKSQIIHMIKFLISDIPLITNHDEADAIALAYTCLVSPVCK